MKLPNSAKVTISGGGILLLLSIINFLSAEYITPEFERAEVLAGLAGVSLMLVGSLWNQVLPVQVTRAQLNGTQTFKLSEELSEIIRNELAWGSDLILRGTPAVTIAVCIDNKVILKRGLVGDEEFIPGNICTETISSGELHIINKTALHPGHEEFDPLLPNLPSILLYPIGMKGIIIIGGWSERCFNKSDRIWISGWGDRLRWIYEKD